jgi:leucyl/phenylalanyl-tRNA--protein transferase
MGPILKGSSVLHAPFPNPNFLPAHGLGAVGGSYESEFLFSAYQQGYFPWPQDDVSPIPWFCPDPRGVLFLSDLKINRTLKKFLKHQTTHFSFKINTSFETILRQCRDYQIQKNEQTWLTENLIQGYTKLHQKGGAYGISLFEADHLIAGFFGVHSGNYVSCESIFSLKDNAGKCALVGFLTYLRQRQIEWVDVQMLTPLSAPLGAKDIRRSDYLKLIKECDWSNLKYTDKKYLFDESALNNIWKKIPT